MIRTTTEIRVRYRDTDQMRVVYNGVYFEYFETGRTEMLRQLGLPYASIESRGVMLPVLEAGAKFIQPARYDDLIRVVTYLRHPVTARLRIEYEIYCGDQLLVTGFTLHAFTTIDTMRPVRPPREFLELIEKNWEEGMKYEV
jgi:acyl-CoA thioester hydrolase